MDSPTHSSPPELERKLSSSPSSEDAPRFEGLTVRFFADRVSMYLWKLSIINHVHPALADGHAFISFYRQKGHSSTDGPPLFCKLKKTSSLVGGLFRVYAPALSEGKIYTSNARAVACFLAGADEFFEPLHPNRGEAEKPPEQKKNVYHLLPSRHVGEDMGEDGQHLARGRVRPPRAVPECDVLAPVPGTELSDDVDSQIAEIRHMQGALQEWVRKAARPEPVGGPPTEDLPTEDPPTEDPSIEDQQGHLAQVLSEGDRIEFQNGPHSGAHFAIEAPSVEAPGDGLRVRCAKLMGHSKEAL